MSCRLIFVATACRRIQKNAKERFVHFALPVVLFFIFMVGYPRAFLMLKPFYHKIICLSSLLAPCCASFSLNETLSPACFSLRLRTFWRARVHAVGGTMHRVVQNPVSEHNKNQTNIVGFFCRSVSNVNRIIRLYLQLNTKYLFDDI